MKKFLSLILSFAMLATMLASVPVAQAGSIDDVPFIPVDLPFNADVIGKIGETPGANWANNAFMTGLGISGTCGIWNNISDDTIEFNEGGWDGVKLLPEGETAIPGDTGNLTNAKNNGYNIYKVRITSESLSAGVDDALVLSGTAATIPMSGRVVDRIMFMRMKMRYTQGSDTLRFKVNYADGTTETTDFVMGCSGHSSYTVDTIPYSEWYGNSGAQFRTGTGSDYTVITDASTGKLRALASTDCTQYGWPPSGNMKGFEMIYLPVDSSKEVESVELGTTAASNGNYIFAATEIPVSAEALTTSITTIWEEIEATDFSAITDKTELEKAIAGYNNLKRYTDEYELRGGLLSDIIDEDRFNAQLALIDKLVISASFDEVRKNATSYDISFATNIDLEPSDVIAKTKVYVEDVLTSADVSYDSESKVYTANVSTGSDEGREVRIVLEAGIPNPNCAIASEEIEYSFTTQPLLDAWYGYNALNIENLSASELPYTVYFAAYDADSRAYAKAVTKKTGTLSGASDDTDLDEASVSSGVTGAEVAWWVLDSSGAILAKSEFDYTSESAVTCSDTWQKTLNIDTNSITVYGKADCDSAFILAVNPNGSYQYAGSAVKNSDGGFVFDISVNETAIPTPGDITFKVYAQDGTELYGDSVYFASTAHKKAAVDEIYACKDEYDADGNSDPDGINDGLNADSEKLLSLSSTVYDAVDKAELSDIISANKEVFNTSSGATPQSAYEAIRLYALLAAYNTSRTDLCTEGGKIAYTDILGIDEIDNTEGVTINSVYNTVLNDTGRSLVASDLMSKGYTDCETLVSDYKKAVIIRSIRNAATGSTGHISSVLTTANAAEAGLDVSAYLSADEATANNHIYNGAPADITALAELISTIPEKKPAETVTESSDKKTNNRGTSSVKVSKDIVSGETVVPPVTTPQVQSGSFSDVAPEHWAFEAINSLCKKGIINGRGNGNFDPDGVVTREEFVKLLLGALDIQPSGELTGFADVDGSAWYAPYVSAAYHKGIVNGISDTAFGVGQSLTRQDMCVIIARAASLNGEEAEIEFEDGSMVSDYAKSAVSVMAQKGIVVGSEGYFRPTDSLSRAEAAMVLMRLMKEVGIYE